jgi:cytochrome c peroxidase
MRAHHTAVFVMGFVLACGDDGGTATDSDSDGTTTTSGTSTTEGTTTSTSGPTTEGTSSTSTGDDSESSSSSSTGEVELGCDAEAPQIGSWTSQESAIACSMSPLPELPASPTNAFADDPGAAILGQKFYFEQDWAGPLLEDNALGTAGTEGLVSCHVCHDTETFASIDPRGVGTGLHPRHAPGSVNAAFFDQAGFTWRGRFDVMWALPRVVFEAGPIFNTSRLRVAHVVFEQYREEYDAVFTSTPLPDLSDLDRFPPEGRPKGNPEDPDGPWEGMTEADQQAVNLVIANVGKALEAYQRLLVSRNSAFDRFVAGDTEALSESAQRGFQLFVGKASCVQCHSGPLFSDQSYRNLGLEPTDGDQGRYDVVGAIAGDPWNGAGSFSDDAGHGQEFLDAVEPQTEDLRGRFRVPSVRDAARSAPYMHNGSIATLDELIDFYDEGGSDVPDSELAGQKIR